MIRSFIRREFAALRELAFACAPEGYQDSHGFAFGPEPFIPPIRRGRPFGSHRSAPPAEPVPDRLRLGLFGRGEFGSFHTAENEGG